MDFALIGFILAMALMAFIVAGSYSPEAPVHVIERKRAAYRQALTILRNRSPIDVEGNPTTADLFRLQARPMRTSKTRPCSMKHTLRPI